MPLVARYADACNLFDVPDEGRTVARKLGVLAGHCAAIGRPYHEIDTTLSMRVDPDEAADSVVRRCSRLAQIRIGLVVALTPEPWSMETVASLGQAAAALDPRR